MQSEEDNMPDPFLKLFWEEQKKAAERDPRGMRWHPTMIRFDLYSQIKYDFIQQLHSLNAL